MDEVLKKEEKEAKKRSKEHKKGVKMKLEKDGQKFEHKVIHYIMNVRPCVSFLWLPLQLVYSINILGIIHNHLVKQCIHRDIIMYSLSHNSVRFIFYIFVLVVVNMLFVMSSKVLKFITCSCPTQFCTMLR